ncbi:hypothetical protein CHLNCDRAFT_133673 [Chlorella variabilis]|uniref:Protein MCM10 homolog n=1 Tax=Chlorella variabilis TaxID=554065 RepID=E1Z3K0_CHLVA|nr:hypothetical protein CHLNCDRAFT_133673 [Chlorella variabilis]EFN59862.1 hypothetical protein CHLNCDRAFT_133673 [Chlorella variabilis]|eukprot:XP_005851964.1 hypothetical protein CHLNCDRAFT_133673 [Chlorella variabilis]
MSAPLAAPLEEGDDVFLELAAAMEAEEEEDGAEEPPPTASQRSSGAMGGGSSAGGPRLSWAARAAAAGSAGAVPPGHQPRQAVLLPPGSIPCAPTAPLLLPASQPAAAAGGSGVVVFGSRGGVAGGSTGAAAAGTFSDIKNPRVSHTQLRSRLADTSVLRLSQVRQRHRTAGLEGSWVAICVVGEKSKPRETAAGRSYSIWKVTDLDQTCLSLFLFSGAHDELWREAEGSIVALLSPKVKTEGDFSLSVDSADQARALSAPQAHFPSSCFLLCLMLSPPAVWVLGQSTEFGYCKSKKKNGEPCRMPVNAARCPFCPYHVKSEYNRMKPTGRTEFQTSNLKTAFRPGLQRGLPWAPGEFEVAALGGVAASARNKGSDAGARYLDTVANPAAVAAAEAAAKHRLTPAAAIAAAQAKGRTEAALAAAPIPAGRPGGSLVLQLPRPKQQQQQGKRKAGVGRPGGGGKRRSSNVAGEGSGLMIELADEEDEEVEAAGCGAAAAAGGGGGGGGSAYDPAAAARQRAVELLRAAGGAAAPDPNSSRRVPQVMQAAVQRVRASQPAGGSNAAAAAPAAAAAATAAAAAAAGGEVRRAAAPSGAAAAAAGGRRPALAQTQAHRPPPLPSVVSGGPAAARPPPPSAMEAAFGGVLQEAGASSAAVQGTRYKELVDDEEFEKLDKVMSVLEQKDEMAARMEGVTRLAVQAFRCKLCCYTAERRRRECSAHPHAVERVEVTKRWWQCQGCKHRFTTVGLKYPAGRCAKCNQPGTEFKSVGMFRPPREHELQRQQSAVAGRDQLAARGAEQKWANSW